MPENKRQLWFGILILFIGLFALISKWKWSFNLNHIIGGLFLIALGYIILQKAPHEQSNWGKLILASLLFSLGLLIILNALFPVISDLTGSLFLWLVALFFGGVYMQNDSKWWAALVAGILFTNGTISMLQTLSLMNQIYFSGIFFLGLGLTFTFLWMTTADHPHLQWAKFPAIALLLFSIWCFLSTHYWLNLTLYIAIILIVTGILIIARTIRQKHAPKF